MPLALGVFEKMGVVLRCMYFYVSYAYLALMIGRASAPQHSFAAHLSSLTINESLLVGYALVGLAVGLFEMFRKPSKKSEGTGHPSYGGKEVPGMDKISDSPPHVG